MIKAGNLNQTITFRRKTVAYDSYNQPIETWADAATVRAAVQTTGGREFYAAQKLYSEMTALFKIRYTQAFNARMQVKWMGRIFEIIAPPFDPNGRREELHVVTKEVA
jgi:SPP1 family predicted phage head-tail adaptor